MSSYVRQFYDQYPQSVPRSNQSLVILLFPVEMCIVLYSHRRSGTRASACCDLLAEAGAPQHLPMTAWEGPGQGRFPYRERSPAHPHPRPSLHCSPHSAQMADSTANDELTKSAPKSTTDAPAAASASLAVPNRKRSMSVAEQVCATPISNRTTKPGDKVIAYLTVIGFVVVLAPMHALQVLLWPFSLVPGTLRDLYWSFIRQTEESFVSGRALRRYMRVRVADGVACLSQARLLVFIGGNTELVLSSEGELELAVVKDEHGETQLDLAPHSVWIANHQSYLDWVYAWCFAYFANTAGGKLPVSTGHTLSTFARADRHPCLRSALDHPQALA